MIRVPLPGKVRHLVQAHLDNCREQAITRFDRQSWILSEMGIFHQL